MSVYRQLWIHEQKARLELETKLKALQMEYSAAIDLLQQVHTVTNMVDLERFKADVDEYQLESGERLGWMEEFEEAA